MPNEELIKRLDLLATKMNTTGEHLWEILVKQGTIEGYKSIASVAIMAIMFFAIKALLPKIIKTFKDDNPDVGVPLIAVGIVLILVFAMSLSELSDLQYFFNPEYFALTEVLKILK